MNFPNQKEKELFGEVYTFTFQNEDYHADAFKQQQV
jgi:hypothetical protein